MAVREGIIGEEDDGSNKTIELLSHPSKHISVKVFDSSPPEPPTWNSPEPGDTPGAIVLLWESPISNLRCLVQCRLEHSITWENASGWLPRGQYTYVDNDRITGLRYVYRLRVMDAKGKTNDTYNELTV